ncbi:MAG: OmpA family protein, partial [bacterium]|nr:OmpA family protein [bacterium]
LVANPKLIVHASGHTDNAHSEQFNWELSKRRVMTVQRYLMGHGVPATQFMATFHGETDPAAENDTEDHRALNRRVELTLE